MLEHGETEPETGAADIKAITENGEGEDETDGLQNRELERLHALGIPVPGVEIKVDKMVAKVWLEDLEVECGNKVFGERVRAVVERAVEVVAPLWG
jgi:cleavage and polyadenylation specificity factor subunit 3